MSPDEPIAFNTVISKLQTIAVEAKAQIRFQFYPNAVGPYGNEGSQWQAVFIQNGMGTIDYGFSVEEAARRLLDRLLHPELYPETDPD